MIHFVHGKHELAKRVDCHIDWADGPVTRESYAAIAMVSEWRREDLNVAGPSFSGSLSCIRTQSLGWLIDTINGREIHSNGHRNVRVQYIVDQLVKNDWVYDDDPPHEIDMEGDPLWEACHAALPGAFWVPCKRTEEERLYWSVDTPIGIIKSESPDYFDLPWGGYRTGRELRTEMLEWSKELLIMVNSVPKTEEET